MFEQQSYDQEVSALRTQPGDLFHNFEIRNWNFSPRLYKILVISAVLNIAALVVIGTSGLLTARGCDSPFVGRVCQVLDTVYVGSLIFGTESEYADVDYTKTELADAEVTFVDVTGVTPPLTYPEGYFQLANPEQQFANVTDPMSGQGFLAPGIPANPTIGGSGLINTPPIAAPNNPNTIEGDLPTGSPLGEVNDSSTVAGTRKGRRGPRRGPLDTGTGADANTNPANTNTNTANPTVAENAEEDKEDQFGVFINKRPLRVEAKESLEEIDAGKVKIDTPFKVVISATLGLGKDGKTIVLKNPKPVPSNPPVKNDPVMEKFVQDWILAVGDAGWFGYLDKLKTKKVIITVEQNESEFIASVKADQPSDNDAKQAASGLGTLLSIAAPAASGDEQLFLQTASVTAEGKTFVLNFVIPKPLVQEMIMRKLAESKDKEAKPEGNAFARPSNNTAKR
jgi:hypothetical protein